MERVGGLGVSGRLRIRSSSDIFDNPAKKRRILEASASIVTNIPELASLPPIETLRPDDLKHFSREQLAAYLTSQGIQMSSNEAKPVLKQQLRLILSEMERKRAGISHSDSPSIETVSPLSPVEGNEPKKCSDCEKKSNRECLFARCRGCCNKRGFNCHIHFSRGTRSTSTPPATPPSIINGHSPFPMFPLSQGNTLTLPPSQSPSSSPSLPSSGESLPMGKAVYTMAIPPEANSKMARCPSCNRMISCAGSTFFIHLSECDREFFLSWLQSGESAEELTGVKKDEGTPVQLAKKNAKDRWTAIGEYLEDLFSSLPVDQVLESISDLSEDGKGMEEKIKSLEQSIEQDSKRYQKKMEMWEKERQQFEDNLRQIRSCSSLEELEECKETLGLTVEKEEISKVNPKELKLSESSKLEITQL